MYIYCGYASRHNTYVQAGAVAYMRGVGLAGTSGTCDRIYVFEGDNAKNDNPILAPWAEGWRWFSSIEDLIEDTRDLHVLVADSQLARDIATAYPTRRYSFAGVLTNAD